MNLSDYNGQELLNEIIKRDCLDDLLSDKSYKYVVIRSLQFSKTKELIKELENREDLSKHVECVSDILVESKLSSLRMSTDWDRNSAKEYINIILKLNGLNDSNDIIESIKELYKY